MNFRIIRLLICFIILIVFSQINSQDYWLSLNSPTTQLLRRVFFTDNLTGWAAGDRGTIIHTKDGGDTWLIQDSGVETGVVDIFFLNNVTGWALIWSVSNPSGTVILKTKDGGENWAPENYPEPNKYMRKIFFMDSLRGWMGGSPDAFVYTIDGGMEWTNVVIDSGVLGHLPPLNFSFFDSNYGFANGGIFDIAGVIWKTTNGGINWFSMGVGPEPIQKIIFFDSLNALGVGGDFEFGTGIVRTYDAGESWQYTSLGVAGIAAAVSFRTSSEGWSCLGSAQKFIFTNDSGNTWTEVPTPNNSKIFDLVFTDSLHGYAVGDNGTILKYDTTVVGLPKLNLKSTISPFKLYQNYPNPFNPNTTISYHLTETSKVVLRIYNIVGQKVKQLINEKQVGGDYQIQWSGRDEAGINVASGIYFYQLEVGNKFSEAKKMVLMR